MAEDPLPLARADPKGLIREAYRIEGIGMAECRSILVDWALSLAPDIGDRAALTSVLTAYGVEGHPMTNVLREGLAAADAPRRRGGRAGRLEGLSAADPPPRRPGG